MRPEQSRASQPGLCSQSPGRGKERGSTLGKPHVVPKLCPGISPSITKSNRTDLSQHRCYSVKTCAFWCRLGQIQISCLTHTHPHIYINTQCCANKTGLIRITFSRTPSGGEIVDVIHLKGSPRNTVNNILDLHVCRSCVMQESTPEMSRCGWGDEGPSCLLSQKTG